MKPTTLRSMSATGASGAWSAVLAAVRPEHQAWSAPWSRLPRASTVVPALFGLYGLVVAIATASAVLNGRGGLLGGVAFLYLLPAVLGLAVAPRRPLDGWLAVTCWLVVLRLLVPAAPEQLPVMETWHWLLWLPVLLLAAWAARGRALLGVALISLAALIACAIVDPLAVDAGSWSTALVWLGAPLVLGSALGARQRARSALVDEQERAEEALARQGALAERARIAREMHDVVAHHMSMIAVRAETAPYRLPDVPPPVRTEFAEVATAARRSLAEMQGLLGVLRSEDGADRAPQPGLGDLEELLRSARAAGAPLEWELDLPEAPAALGLSAYRIVQQGLANAAQHAPGAPVEVRVTGEDGVLRIEVVNGPGTAPSAASGGGNGLPGMRERAALHGGTVDAGPLPDGSFRLAAELPVAGR
ncbi:sensor histidine kinase [Blastococcus xanthinilyticus]|uniref:histidine kinase n=1 Tax=Blastococcus xanthinilyticus TaxID=1564164 RepID=A0A5S5D4D1_9ACTN|nr:histidine kinase [Blastococcus xanthinilyticus]TYP90810.1 signal transduction histidine kinase [Blastococcus xanthinilyticus]